jgi:hypothetical protein
VTVPLWCSAVQSAFSAPFQFSFLTPASLRKHPLYIRRRQFTRDAAKPLLPPSPSPLALQTTPATPALSRLRTLQLSRTSRTPHRLLKGQQDSRLALVAARCRPANSFLESPADFVTRAPNFLRLGQAGRARQDLVRESESTTKYGDCGEESPRRCASIGYADRIRKARMAVHPRFPVSQAPEPPSGSLDNGLAGADRSGSGSHGRPVGRVSVTDLSRNDKGFLPILSEMARKIASFCARRPLTCSYTLELTTESATNGDDSCRPTLAPPRSATPLSGRRPD